MNNKGFTTIEVILSFALLVIIMGTLTGITISYRDKLTNSEIKTSVLDFKNSMYKIIYDDIIGDNIVKAEYCIGESNCVNLVNIDGDTRKIKLVTQRNSALGRSSGVYLVYDDIYYLMPGSDYNVYNNADPSKDTVVATMGSLVLDNNYESSNIYKISVSMVNRNIDYSDKIIIVIN